MKHSTAAFLANVLALFDIYERDETKNRANDEARVGEFEFMGGIRAG